VKVNLLYCPFVDPVTPPLGIASLKSALEKDQAVRVRCLDLNLEWHHRLVAEIAEARRRTQVPPELEQFEAAAGLLRSRGADFFDLEKYNRASVDFIQFTRSLHLKTIKLLNDPQSAQAKQKVAEFIEYALSGNPDVVGFSLLFDEQVAFSLYLAKLIKELYPQKIIAFGGAALDSSFNHILAQPYVDYAIRDAAEVPFLQLLQSLERGALDTTIPGLVYRQGGQVVSNPVQRTNMDANPYPDFSDHRLESYFTTRIVIPVLSQKGCYWAKCSFCAEGTLNVYAKASVARVVDEIAHHVQRGHRHFHFVDEMIAAKRFREISEEILRRQLEVYFYAYLRPGSDYTREALDVMYKAGCRYVVWGLESANPRVLELVNKGTTVESIRSTFTNARDAGIRNHAFVMVGFPTETPEELFETMQFIHDHADIIHHTHRSFYCLLEGTEIYRNPAKFGVSITELPGSVHGKKNISVKYKAGTTTEIGESLMVYYYDTFLKDLEIAPAYGVFRDHALFHYTNFDIQAHQRKRGPVPQPGWPLALLARQRFAGQTASLLENPMRNRADAPRS
jgi:anaerobic magnesium-protoporphyrin IX monomethyl ester cyclase